MQPLDPIMEADHDVRQTSSARKSGVAAMAAALPLLAGCTGVLDPAGPIAAQEKTLLINALAIMLLIVVPVIIGTLAFAFWFRASNARATRHPGFVYSGKVEIVTWGVPVLAVLLLSGLAYFGAHRLDPYKPIESRVQPVRVEVVSLDWKWLFIYPDLGIASINQLVIPAGTPIEFRLTSATVMNTFYVSRLGSMIYTMNGMATRLHLQADRPGAYHGMSAHYSGDGFVGMNFAVRSVSPADFAAWTARTRAATAPVLDRAAYAGLLRQTMNVAPFTFRSVQPGLFDAIVEQSLPPGDGPRPANPSTATPADRTS